MVFCIGCEAFRVWVLLGVEAQDVGHDPEDSGDVVVDSWGGN